MAAALDLSCPEPSTLEAQHASCFVFSSQCGGTCAQGAFSKYQLYGKWSSGLFGMQPACLSPASSTLDPVSLDRQFKIHTFGQLGYDSSVGQLKNLDPYWKNTMGFQWESVRTCLGLDYATKVCHHKAPQKHPLLVNPPVTECWSGKATRGARSKAPCAQSRGRGAPCLSATQDTMAGLAKWRPMAKFWCTATTCKTWTHMYTHTHTHAYTQKEKVQTFNVEKIWMC